MPTEAEIRAEIEAALVDMDERPVHYAAEEILTAAGYDKDDFTEAETTCISRKISRLSGGGKPNDQAVSIAIAMCAPSKARQADFAMFQRYHREGYDYQMTVNDMLEDINENEEPASDIVNADGFLEIPHGGYTARQRPNGNWDMFDVPSFAEHVRVMGDGRILKVDKEFQEISVAESQRKLKEDKTLMPLKVRHRAHHGGQHPPEFAGFHILQRVGLFKINGKEVWTTFADYININPWVYKQIKNLELPYRSAEMSDPDKPQIDAIALLDVEPSFFDMELTGVGEEFPNELEPMGDCAMAEVAGFSKTKESVFRYKEGPAVCYRRSGNQTMVLFKFEEKSEEDEMTKPADYQNEDETKKKKDEEEGDTVIVNAKDDEKDDKGADFQAEEPAAPNLRTILTDLMGGIAQALAALPEEKVEEVVEEEAPNQLPKPPVDVAAQRATDVAVDAALAGENLAYRKENEALKATVAITETVSKTLKELKASGLNVSDTDAVEFTKYARQGTAAYTVFVDTFKKHATVTPPTTFAGEMNPEVRPTCKETDEYSQYGPDMRVAAEACAVDYRKMPTHVRAKKTLAEYLAIEYSSTKFAHYTRNGAAV